MSNSMSRETPIKIQRVLKEKKPFSRYADEENQTVDADGVAAMRSVEGNPGSSQDRADLCLRAD